MSCGSSMLAMILFLYLLPLVSVYAGIQFLSESLTAQILLGGALIVCGVWIASRNASAGRPAACPSGAP
jgi:drug/metabolite transporter (DMT)-like permease